MDRNLHVVGIRVVGTIVQSPIFLNGRSVVEVRLRSLRCEYGYGAMANFACEGLARKRRRSTALQGRAIRDTQSPLAVYTKTADTVKRCTDLPLS